MSVNPTDPSRNSAIVVNNLAVWLGNTQILRDISFDVAPGETVALLGGNGSGKTTLLRAILGLIPHRDGIIELLGTPLEQFNSWDQIGYVPQRASVSLHSTTVAEVVGSGTLAKRAVGWMRAADRKHVAEALNAVGLADLAREPYLHLSGGQQQRVLIARGIVNRPRLVLMDEPFAGVDLDNQAHIAATLNALEATVLVVLHETDSLADAIDRTIVLRDGRMVYNGTPEIAHSEGTHEVAAPERTHLLTGMEPAWTS
ncbi:MAG: ATP-binding cassette domain-containing protein [Propionibacteriaceae bacterium]|jgi:zinc transport system ATP-binding protein|nr:ATP-binding cassette domain-containing protein [Propionibacteriaceae bacterium]